MNNSENQQLEQKTNEIRQKISEALAAIFEICPFRKKDITDSCSLSNSAVNNILEAKSSDVQLTTLIRVMLFFSVSFIALELLWRPEGINELLKENLLELDVEGRRIIVPKNYRDRLILYLMKKAKEKKAK